MVTIAPTRSLRRGKRTTMRRFIAVTFMMLTWSVAAVGQVRAVATTHDLSIAGATPHGRVAVCRVANARLKGVETILQQQAILDVGADGVINIPAETEAFRAL